MSIYSSIYIKRSDAVRKIAQCLGVCDEYGNSKDRDGNDEDIDRMLSDILFQLTRGAHHREFDFNNFMVVADDFVPKKDDSPLWPNLRTYE